MNIFLEKILTEAQCCHEDIYPSYDADELGAACVNYKNAINKIADKYEHNVRILISALPNINVDHNANIVLNEEFPKNILTLPHFENIGSVANTAHLCDTLDDARGVVNKYIAAQLGSDTENIPDMVNNCINCRDPEYNKKVVGTTYNTLCTNLRDKLFNTINVIRDLAEQFTAYSNSETVEKFQNDTALFEYLAYVCYNACKVLSNLYIRMYNHVTPKPDHVAKIDKLNADKKNIELRLHNANQLQTAWTNKHGCENNELKRRIQILNEDRDRLNEEIETALTEAEDIHNKVSEKLASQLKDVLDTITKVYDTYDKKEFLKPEYNGNENLLNHVKQAAKRETSQSADFNRFVIPLFTTTSDNKNIKDEIRKNFCSKLAKEIDMHNNTFNIGCHQLSPDDDLHINLSIEKSVYNTLNEGTESDGYHIEHEGRFYVAYDPDGKSLGNEDTYEEASYDIKMDKREKEEKKKSSNTMTEAPYYSEADDIYEHRHGRSYYAHHYDDKHSKQWNDLNAKLTTLYNNAERISSSARDSVKPISPDAEKAYHQIHDEIDKVRSEIRALNEEALTKEEKDKLDDSDFGIPEIREYPMPDADHVRKAIQFFNYAKTQYKQILARNIEKKVIKFDMVGKINVGEKNPGRKYFHAWMLAGSGAKLTAHDGVYEITVKGKIVDQGTLPKTKENKSTINESVIIDPDTGNLYI